MEWPIIFVPAFLSLIALLLACSLIYHFMYGNGSKAAKLRRSAKNGHQQPPADSIYSKIDETETCTIIGPSQTINLGANPSASYPLVQPVYYQASQPQYLQPGAGYQRGGLFGVMGNNELDNPTFGNSIMDSHYRHHHRHGYNNSPFFATSLFNSTQPQPVGMASYPMQTALGATAYIPSQITPCPTFQTFSQPNPTHDEGFSSATLQSTTPANNKPSGRDLEDAHHNVSRSSYYKEVNSSAPEISELNGRNLEGVHQNMSTSAYYKEAKSSAPVMGELNGRNLEGGHQNISTSAYYKEAKSSFTSTGPPSYNEGRTAKDLADQAKLTREN